MFYNGFGCSRECSLGYIGLNLATNMAYSIINRLGGSSWISREFGGICAKCPYKCLICEKHGKIMITYLTCKKCVNGYKVF